MVAFTPLVTRLTVMPDDIGFIPPPGWIDNRDMASNTAETFVVPSGVLRVIIKANQDIWVKFTRAGYDDEVAVVPSSDVTTGGGSMLNPQYLSLSGVSKISIISASNCKVSLSYYT